MYKIPLNFDIQKLKEKQVQQICFSINSITISFGIDEFINIETDFSIIDKLGKCQVTSQLYPIASDYGLLQLLEKSIIDVATNELRDVLTLGFEEGMIIKLHGNPSFESFVIKLGSEKIIV